MEGAPFPLQARIKFPLLQEHSLGEVGGQAPHQECGRARYYQQQESNEERLRPHHIMGRHRPVNDEEWDGGQGEERQTHPQRQSFALPVGATPVFYHRAHCLRGEPVGGGQCVETVEPLGAHHEECYTRNNHEGGEDAAYHRRDADARPEPLHQ